MSRAIHVFQGPDRFITGTVGQPGDRAFYIQAARGNRVISVALEKQQVQVLADRVGVLLDEVSQRFGIDIPPKPDKVDDLSPLEMPVDEEFRVGTMGLGWDSEAHSVVVELLAMHEGELDESIVLDNGTEGPDAVRVYLSPRAAREFVLRTELVVAAGRPVCPLCGQSIDPDGHLCVRLNGYRRDVTLDRTLFLD